MRLSPPAVFAMLLLYGNKLIEAFLELGSSGFVKMSSLHFLFSFMQMEMPSNKIFSAIITKLLSIWRPLISTGEGGDIDFAKGDVDLEAANINLEDGDVDLGTAIVDQRRWRYRFGSRQCRPRKI